MMARRGASSLGVDIGSSSIKVAELDSSGPAILNAGTIGPLADNSVEEVGNALAELVGRKKFRTKRAVAAVSSTSGGAATARRIFMEHVTADIKKAELKERVEWEAITRDYIPFPAEEAIVDCQVLGEATKENIPGLWVFFVAVHRDLVKNRVDILRAADLTPVAMEIDFSAILGLLSYMDVFPDDEDVAVIDIGATKTSIGVIYRRQLAFYRDISVAGDHITSQIERRLRVQKQEAEDYKLTEDLFEKISDGTDEIWRAASPIESVIEERQGLYQQIRECFRYYEGDVANPKLSKVFFSGGTSQLRNLDNFLSHRLVVPIESVHFLDRIPVAAKGDVSEIEGREPIFATAVGLALKPFRAK
jgi:type IV pilus assembly protein PilM